MRLTLIAPPGNLRGPQYMEQALAAIHAANRGRLPVTFAVQSDGKTASLSCRVPRALARTVATQIGGHYPDCTVRLSAETVAPADTPAWYAHLRLRPDVFPIRRYAQFEDALNRNSADPLTGLFAALIPEGLPTPPSRIELSVWPAPERFRTRARRVLARLHHPFFHKHPRLARAFASAATSSHLPVRILAALAALFLPSSDSDPALEPTPSQRTHDREGDLQGAMDKLRRHLFTASLRLVVTAGRDEAHVARLQIGRMAGAFAQFTVPRMATFCMSRIRFHRRAPRARRCFLLSAEELATLWHPPTSTVRAPAMLVTESRELEPPVTLPRACDSQEIAILGRTKFRSRHEVFGIQPDDRRRHLAVIGKTGMGKTTLLEHLIASDIRAGRGVCLIDPHGDLADAILAAVPPARTNQTIVFDASDRDFPVSFNPLVCPDAGQRGLVASGIVSAFKRLCGESWGPRLEHNLRNAL